MLTRSINRFEYIPTNTASAWALTFSPTAMPSNPSEQMNLLHPKKLLLTKWTAVKPINKNKHFLVSKVIEPELPDVAIEWIELEAVYSKSQIRLAWRDLRDTTQWKQGWV